MERVAANDSLGAVAGSLRNNSLFFAWKAPQDAATLKETLNVTQDGAGKPWLTLQSTAAVPLKAPFAAGYAIKKTVMPVEQAKPGKYTRGEPGRVERSDLLWNRHRDAVPAKRESSMRAS